MTYTAIALHTEQSTAVLTLNRPSRRNALSLQMMAEIIDACAIVEADPNVHALILTGGADCFSAGADLTEAQAVKTITDGTRFFGSLHRLNQAVETLGKPVIAAIEGPCITGGCELALACDLRIAGAGASFAITSTRIGTIAGAGGTQRLPRLVGMGHALELLLSANAIDADEALRIGLINRKTAAGGAFESALEMAAVFAERAPLSLSFTKQAVREGMQMDLQSALKFEMALVSTIYATEDKQEGIAAFLEKRKPRFRGH